MLHCHIVKLALNASKLNNHTCESVQNHQHAMLIALKTLADENVFVKKFKLCMVRQNCFWTELVICNNIWLFMVSL